MQERKLLLKKVRSLKEQLGHGEGREEAELGIQVILHSCLLPPASCHLLLPPASCLLPPASCFLPPASCHLLPTNCLQCDMGHSEAMVEAYSGSVGKYREVVATLNRSGKIPYFYLKLICEVVLRAGAWPAALRPAAP